MKTTIQRFKPQDASTIASLIKDNLIHVNVRDYDLASMQAMSAQGSRRGTNGWLCAYIRYC